MRHLGVNYDKNTKITLLDQANMYLVYGLLQQDALDRPIVSRPTANGPNRPMGRF